MVCGLTGSGKSRLLATLDRLGAQVLDLEQLAAHRGSVLGGLPLEQQPSQKMFESRLWFRLRGFDAKRPVFVESESKRIGALHLPDDLMTSMWDSECIKLETSTAARVDLLADEYSHFLSDAAALGVRLDMLLQMHGRVVIEEWKEMAQQGRWNDLVRELLERHYDPAYTRSIGSHYPKLTQARTVEIAAYNEEAFASAAQAVLESV